MTDQPVTIAPKPWQQSLTVQGGLVAGAGALVLANGPSLLGFTGLVDAATAAEITKDLAGILTAVGALMSVIGRLRLGGLH